MKTLFIGGPADGEWHDVPENIPTWNVREHPEDLIAESFTVFQYERKFFVRGDNSGRFCAMVFEDEKARDTMKTRCDQFFRDLEYVQSGWNNFVLYCHDSLAEARPIVAIESIDRGNACRLFLLKPSRGHRKEYVLVNSKFVMGMKVEVGEFVFVKDGRLFSSRFYPHFVQEKLCKKVEQETKGGQQ